MNITAYFASSGTPAAGLSPIINIRDLSDNSLVITGATMSEVGDGFYKYTFAEYDTAKNYTIRCDGGVALLAADRYSIATTGQDGEVSLIKVKTDYLPSATAGAANGLPVIDATGVKLTKTVDLTVGQSIAVSDKTGFSLSATGADLILKSSTFVQAIVAAVNEFATYGLTALNTLLVSTGIKTASTAAPTDMALNSTVAKETTLSAIKLQTDKLTFTTANQVDANVQSVNDKTLIGNGSTIPWGPE